MSGPAAEWYYSVSGKKRGPVGASTLKSLAASKAISPTDFVWKDGMAEWIPARRVKGLFPNDPPPLPATSLTTDAASSAQAIPTHPTVPASRIHFWKFLLLYVSVAVTFIAFAMYVSDRPSKRSLHDEHFAENVGAGCAVLAFGVALTPLFVGVLRRDRSAVLCSVGNYKLYVYEPKTLLGWCGFYFATPLMTILFLLAFAVILYFADVNAREMARQEARYLYRDRYEPWY